MSPIPARVTAVEQRGAQYQVVVEITQKYRGSFNTSSSERSSRTAVLLKKADLTWFTFKTPALTLEIRFHSGLSIDGEEEKWKPVLSVGLPVQPMVFRGAAPFDAAWALIEKINAVTRPYCPCSSDLSAMFKSVFALISAIATFNAH